MVFKKLHPDLTKIKSYLWEGQIPEHQKRGYVQLELVISEEQYESYTNGLKEIFVKYNLVEHTEELLFVIFREDEILGEKLIDDMLRQQHIENAIDVSKFFLAYKTAQDNPLFQIGVKVNTGTENRPNSKNYFIKNEEISKWMCQTLTDAIEKGNYPGGIFGEVWEESIVGLNITGKQHPLRIENLKTGSNLKAKSYNVLTNKRYVEFCQNLLFFLSVHTHLKAPEGIKMTDALANFMFDVLSTLQHLNRETIGSHPKDYINTMIKNTSK